MSTPAAVDALRELAHEAKAAHEAGLYFLAALAALALPDICAAASSSNGRASGPKFRAWIEEYVPEQAADADELYRLRCSMLHQGRAMPDGRAQRIVFTVGTTVIHNLSIEAGSARQHTAGFIDLRTYIDEVGLGVERWLHLHGDSPHGGAQPRALRAVSP